VLSILERAMVGFLEHNIEHTFQERTRNQYILHQLKK
jgi:hypothetical protein